MRNRLIKILFSLALVLSFIPNADAQSLDELKAEFRAAKKKVRELRMEAAAPSEIKAQMAKVKELRAKIQTAQNESFGDLGN